MRPERIPFQCVTRRSLQYAASRTNAPSRRRAQGASGGRRDEGEDAPEGHPSDRRPAAQATLRDRVPGPMESRSKRVRNLRYFAIFSASTFTSMTSFSANTAVKSREGRDEAEDRDRGLWAPRRARGPRPRRDAPRRARNASSARDPKSCLSPKVERACASAMQLSSYPFAAGRISPAARGRSSRPATTARRARNIPNRHSPFPKARRISRNVGTSRMALTNPRQPETRSPSGRRTPCQTEAIQTEAFPGPIRGHHRSLDQARCRQELGEPLDAGESRVGPLVQELAHDRALPEAQRRPPIVPLVPVRDHQHPARPQHAKQLAGKNRLVGHVGPCLDGPDHVEAGVGKESAMASST